VHEHVISAAFLLDEAEALLAVEEFHLALAGPNDLGGHAVETAATAAAAARTTAPTAAKATAWAAAAAILKTTAVLETAAILKTAAAATIVKSATILKTAAEIATGERFETVLANVVPLVAPAPTPFIVTHNSPKTLLLPSVLKSDPDRRGRPPTDIAWGKPERRLHRPAPAKVLAPLSQNAASREPIRNRSPIQQDCDTCERQSGKPRLRDLAQRGIRMHRWEPAIFQPNSAPASLAVHGPGEGMGRELPGYADREWIARRCN